MRKILALAILSVVLSGCATTHYKILPCSQNSVPAGTVKKKTTLGERTYQVTSCGCGVWKYHRIAPPPEK